MRTSRNDRLTILHFSTYALKLAQNHQRKQNTVRDVT
jgi:hypothetical protein